MNQVSTHDKVRPYVPLIGFVIPTVVIAYGFVIPRSCIAGVNELTIGFATTIVGAVLTYIAGQRAAQPRGVCTKPPLGVRIARALNGQAARPRGWLGRILGVVWPIEHGRLNAQAIEALDVRPGQRVLEIGSGTGHTLRVLSSRARGGRTVGVDVSELMVRLARARNRQGIAQNQVEVIVADIAEYPLGKAAFDRILSVHSLYFWRDPEAVLDRVAAALAPGGKLVLAFRPEDEGVPARFRDPTYRFPRTAEVTAALRRAGLEVATFRATAEPGVWLFVATAAADNVQAPCPSDDEVQSLR